MCLYSKNGLFILLCGFPSLLYYEQICNTCENHGIYLLETMEFTLLETENNYINQYIYIYVYISYPQ